MSTLKVHSIESAPDESKASLRESVESFGMLPNLHGVLAESPQALEAYKVLHGLFSNTSFNAEELTVVWQTINVEHECHYCVPAHTGIAHSMKVDQKLIEALRNDEPLDNEKLQVLKDTTLSILRNRGKISDEELERFYAAGYGERHVLDIILGLAQKTMSNYTNHIANTPVDEPFQKFAWSKEVSV
ncbi:carboxymuconolactone decarboxylase family protein [Marinoscillum furvescens]|uniref:AhpD family alkylhydroperoxidase n=1 Tax=Marinoscillum furvescens DSM 4134 TaxID=1122208 RepID=A0A3D9L541_MARFU|nr:carboxymuconolactone decarboxylase family protein [Marinoscillum furvescens]REE01143.1 AhpD family alkylhydroperoxidase [Marinoscillum furvescens DSM 4134]